MKIFPGQPCFSWGKRENAAPRLYPSRETLGAPARTVYNRPMSPHAAIPAAFALFLLGAGCAREEMAAPPAPSLKPQCGAASYYHPALAESLTANGETYDPGRYTAAHKRLPFDTELEVRRRDTGESVEVRVNDRGPFVAGRIIDLSPTAAEEIGLTEGDGVAEVCLVIMKNYS